MPSPKTAVVVGALGVIGRYIVDKLASLPDWEVVGLSRRLGERRPRVRYVAVDLLKLDEGRLSGLTEASHVFYAAFQPSAGADAQMVAALRANVLVFLQIGLVEHGFAAGAFHPQAFRNTAALGRIGRGDFGREKFF